ncbi:MAG: type I-E CRISPR-associated protein Cas5/CasD [Sutterella wadsworthensis]
MQASKRLQESSSNDKISVYAPFRPNAVLGSSSLFWHRGTEFFPTKSGVLGLLFCAMGKGGPQTEALGEIAELPQKVLQLGPSEGKHRQVAILTDFHMVGNGYDENDPWQLECIPKTSEGIRPVNGGARLTGREFLQDASFAVIQEILTME